MAKKDRIVEILEQIDLDDEEYEVFSYNGIPEGCLACGGDYPHCKDSCPMFDD